VRNLLELCSGGGLGAQRFLYEVAPDIFPQGFLTDKEIALWDRHYKDKDNKRTKKIM